MSQTNYWRKLKMNGWTKERKQSQAEKIKQWKPWKKSTGAKTKQGKAKSSQNALKHGFRSKNQIEKRKELNNLIKQSQKLNSVVLKSL